MTSSQQQKIQMQRIEQELVVANSRIVQAHEELESVKCDYQTRIENDAKAVQSQLDSHVDSIQILVSEKAELESTISHQQKEMSELIDEIKRWKSGAKGSSKERTCACTDRVFLAEVERKRLSDNVSNLRDERDRLKIELIDLKQEGLELKSKVEHHEMNSIVLAKQLTE